MEGEQRGNRRPWRREDRLRSHRLHEELTIVRLLEYAVPHDGVSDGILVEERAHGFAIVDSDRFRGEARLTSTGPV